MSLICKFCNQEFERKGARGPAPQFCSTTHYEMSRSNRQRNPDRTINEESFWEKVALPDENGCRVWIAAKHWNGYGAYGPYFGTNRAHRISWTITYGPIPSDLYVLHKCDVRACVEPSHLFLGTQLINIRDSVNKGRHSSVNRIPRT